MTKTQKARADLDRAIAKRDEWQRKVEDLQQRYEEAQNTEIIGVVRQAQLTPEQLAEVIARAREGILNALPEDSADGATGAKNSGATVSDVNAPDAGDADDEDADTAELDVDAGGTGATGTDTREDIAYED